MVAEVHVPLHSSKLVITQRAPHVSQTASTETAAQVRLPEGGQVHSIPIGMQEP